MKKKNSIWIYQLIAIGFVVLLNTRFRKEDKVFDPAGFRSWIPLVCNCLPRFFGEGEIASRL